MKNALIILGNGYDIHHGYDTRYENFIENVKGLEKNIWYIHLKKKMLYSWVNVEEEFNLLINLLLQLEADIPEYFLNISVDIKYRAVLELLGFAVKMPNVETHKTCIGRVGIESLVKEKRYLNYDKCVELMIKDFEILKDALQSYIEAVIGGDDYNYRNDVLLTELTKYTNAVVLNFNYTENISGYIKDAKNIFVHGDVKGEIILGHNNVLDSRFSKFNKHAQQAIVDKHIKNNVYNSLQYLDRRTREFDLIVLGHSFASTDQPIIDWTVKEFYNIKGYMIKELKVFHYVTDEGNKTDLYEKIHNIETFFKNCDITYQELDDYGEIKKLDGIQVLDRLHKHGWIKKLRLQ